MCRLTVLFDSAMPEPLRVTFPCRDADLVERGLKEIAQDAEKTGRWANVFLTVAAEGNFGGNTLLARGDRINGAVLERCVDVPKIEDPKGGPDVPA